MADIRFKGGVQRFIHWTAHVHAEDGAINTCTPACMHNVQLACRLDTCMDYGVRISFAFI